jgi:uncharacterized protein YlxP (DUF503 family)
MFVGLCTITLKADFCHSLKEKRMIIRSITAKVRNKFNVSISEIDNQDIHNLIVLGIATVTNSTAIANNSMQNILLFIEDNTEAVAVNSTLEVI